MAAGGKIPRAPAETPPSCPVNTSAVLLNPSAVVAEHFALFTQVLWVLLALVRYIQAVRFFQGSLFVRVNIDVALDTFLPHVGPGVAAHPFSLALGALVFAKAALLALIWCEALSFGSSLWAVLDVVPLVEAEVAQVVGGRPLAGFPGF